jgi:hypothetical protein
MNVSGLVTSKDSVYVPPGTMIVEFGAAAAMAAAKEPTPGWSVKRFPWAGSDSMKSRNEKVGNWLSSTSPF